MSDTYMTDEPRKVEFPNLGDYEVLDKLLGLRKTFTIHSRILEKTGESYPYYPDEIRYNTLDIDIYYLWEQEEYEILEEIYVQAWIDDAESVFEEYVYFSTDEFIDGIAETVLKDRS